MDQDAFPGPPGAACDELAAASAAGDARALTKELGAFCAGFGASKPFNGASQAELLAALRWGGDAGAGQAAGSVGRARVAAAPLVACPPCPSRCPMEVPPWARGSHPRDAAAGGVGPILSPRPGSCAHAACLLPPNACAALAPRRSSGRETLALHLRPVRAADSPEGVLLEV
jgi:hypothetical protein